MKWNELKMFCCSLNEIQLLKDVILWREDSVISDIEPDVLQEDHYYDPEEPTDGCFTLSDAGYQAEDVPSLEIAYKSGTPILWEKF